METHRKWLLNPPAKKPEPQDFGLNKNSYRPLTKSEVNAFMEFLYMLVRDCIEFLEPTQQLRDLLLEKLIIKRLLNSTLFLRNYYQKCKNIPEQKTILFICCT